MYEMIKIYYTLAGNCKKGLESYVEAEAEGPAGCGFVLPVGEAPDGIDIQNTEDIAYAAAEFDVRSR